MEKNKTKIKLALRQSLFLLVVLIPLPLFFARQVFAASLYLTTPNALYLPGDTVPVTVNLDTGSDSVNALTVSLSYPASLLSLGNNWLDTSSTAFNLGVKASGAGGSVKITRGSITPVSGVVNVVTLNFLATTVGSANLDFNSDSAVVRTTDNANVLTSSPSKQIQIVESLETPQPATASSTLNLSPATPSPVDLSNCSAIQKQTFGHLSQSLDLALSYQQRISSIDQMFENYYNIILLGEGKKLYSFGSYTDTLNKDQTLVNGQIDLLKNAESSFNCSSGNVKSVLAKFITDYESTKQDVSVFLEDSKKFASDLNRTQ